MTLLQCTMALKETWQKLPCIVVHVCHLPWNWNHCGKVVCLCQHGGTSWPVLWQTCPPPPYPGTIEGKEEDLRSLQRYHHHPGGWTHCQWHQWASMERNIRAPNLCHEIDPNTGLDECQLWGRLVFAVATITVQKKNASFYNKALLQVCFKVSSHWPPINGSSTLSLMPPTRVSRLQTRLKHVWVSSLFSLVFCF